MKHLFITLSILTTTLTLTLTACSKKDWLPVGKNDLGPVRITPAAKDGDTPYGKVNLFIHQPVREPVIKIIRAAKDGDTPYGKVNLSVYQPVKEPVIKIIPAAKDGDTPYGKAKAFLLPLVKKNR